MSHRSKTFDMLPDGAIFKVKGYNYLMQKQPDGYSAGGFVTNTLIVETKAWTYTNPLTPVIEVEDGSQTKG